MNYTYNIYTRARDALTNDMNISPYPCPHPHPHMHILFFHRGGNCVVAFPAVVGCCCVGLVGLGFVWVFSRAWGCLPAKI